MTPTPHQDSFKKMKKSISPELKNLLERRDGLGVCVRIQTATLDQFLFACAKEADEGAEAFDINMALPSTLAAIASSYLLSKGIRSDHIEDFAASAFHEALNMIRKQNPIIEIKGGPVNAPSQTRQ